MTTRRQLLKACGAGALVATSSVLAQDTEHDPDCIFCRIESGAAESVMVYRDEWCMAFADRFPFVPGHTLVVPRRHVRDIYALDADLAGHVFQAAAHLARTMKRVLKPDGMTVLQNNELAGGQSVFHFHLHLVPRTTGVELFTRLRPRPEVGIEDRERMFAPLRAALS